MNPEHAKLIVVLMASWLIIQTGFLYFGWMGLVWLKKWSEKCQ